MEKLGLTIDVESKNEYSSDIGDIIPLDEFLDLCDSESLIDYDGYACEVLLDGKIISKETFYPSGLISEGIGDQLLSIQEKFGVLSVVWYNR